MRGTSGAENSVDTAVRNAERERRQEQAKRQTGAALAAGPGKRRI